MLDVRQKAIFTTLLQTGLSEIDACALNIEDVEKELGNPPVYIEGYRQKTSVPFQTCIGEDACVAIRKYLTLRGNPKKGILFETKFEERMTPRAIREALEPVEKVIPHFKVKMLRDMFHDSLERGNVTQNTSRRMFGHELGVTGKYQFSPHTIKAAYLRAYPFLKINDVTRTASRDKSIAELVLRLGEIVSIIATEGQQQGMWSLTQLISELKGKETTPKAKALFEHKLRRSFTEQEKGDIRKEFNEALRIYLKSI